MIRMLRGGRGGHVRLKHQRVHALVRGPGADSAAESCVQSIHPLDLGAGALSRHQRRFIRRSPARRDQERRPPGVVIATYKPPYRRRGRPPRFGTSSSSSVTVLNSAIRCGASGGLACTTRHMRSLSRPFATRTRSPSCPVRPRWASRTPACSSGRGCRCDRRPARGQPPGSAPLHRSRPGRVTRGAARGPFEQIGRAHV